MKFFYLFFVSFLVFVCIDNLLPRKNPIQDKINRGEVFVCEINNAKYIIDRKNNWIALNKYIINENNGLICQYSSIKLK